MFSLFFLRSSSIADDIKFNWKYAVLEGKLFNNVRHFSLLIFFCFDNAVIASFDTVKIEDNFFVFLHKNNKTSLSLYPKALNTLI